MEKNTLMNKEYADILVALKNGQTGFNAEIGGVMHRFSAGGLHGSVKNQKYFSNEEQQIINLDFVNFYAFIMIMFVKNWVYGRMTKEEFSGLLQARVKAKFSGNTKVAKELKAKIEPIYGESRRINNQYGLDICLFGQRIMLYFIKKLLSLGVKLINTNTDGIYVLYPKEQEALFLALVEACRAKIKIPIEYTKIHAMYIADTNCYAVELGESYTYRNGVKVELKPDIHKLCLKGIRTSSIVETAIVKEILYGEDSKMSITSCTEPSRFGKQFSEPAESCRWLVNNTWRVLPNIFTAYATNENLFGIVGKVKGIGTIVKLPQTSDHVIVDNQGLIEMKDIDVNFYVKQAKSYVEKIKKKVGNKYG